MFLMGKGRRDTPMGCGMLENLWRGGDRDEDGWSGE